MIVIAEPTTTLTDYLLAALLGLMAARLTTQPGRAVSRGRALWAVAFALGAVSALAGGTEHGLRPWLDGFSRALLRQVAYLGSAAAGVLLLAGLVFELLKGRQRRQALLALAALGVLELLVIARAFEARDAAWVGAVNLVLLLALAARRAEADSRLLKWLAGAVGLAGAGIAVQLAGIAPHPSLNANDLSHLLLCAALWPFYRAALLLEG